MDPSSYRGLTFLLSLGTLPIACNPEKGDTTDGGSTSNGTGSASASGTTDATGTGATDGGPTSGATSGGTTGGATETGGPGGVCEAYVAYVIRCSPDQAGHEAELLALCEMQRKGFEAIRGPACLALYDALYECLSMAECESPACDGAFDAAFACKPEPGELCTAYAEKYGMCVPGPYAELAGGECQYELNYGAYTSGPACGVAIEEWYACLNGLPCADFEMGTGCEAQVMKIEQECMFGDGAAPARPGPPPRAR